MRRMLRCALFAATACGAETAQPSKAATSTAAALAPDTAAAVDLSKLTANVPAAVADTFTPVDRRREAMARLPEAPPPLLDAVEREAGISRFCYQEYGQKVDPKLVGAVALVVTVEDNAVRRVRVGYDEWTSPAGRDVNVCLAQKATQAWRLLPGSRVTAGQYLVQLRFRPT